MKKVAFLTFLAVLVFSLSFSACDSFFSTSLGKFREYELSKISVNAKNIDEWVNRCVGNPALASAVNKKIDLSLRGQPLTPGNAKLLAGRVKLSALSVGLGNSILSNASSALADLMDNKDPTTTLSKVLNKILKEFQANGGNGTAKELANLLSNVAIVSGSTNVGQTPTFNPEYIKVVEASDVAETILVLVMAEISNATINLQNWDEVIDKIASFDFSGNKVIVKAPGTPTNTQIALAAYLNLLTDPAFSAKANDNPITKALKSALL
jgi:hypothetical protein